MEKHIIGILIIINFTLTGKVSAQEQSKVDSIKQVIAIAKHDTTYAKGYLDLGYLYEHISPDTAMHFYLKVIEIANKTIHSLPKETNWKLIETKSFDTGVVNLTYEKLD